MNMSAAANKEPLKDESAHHSDQTEQGNTGTAGENGIEEAELDEEEYSEYEEEEEEQDEDVKSGDEEEVHETVTIYVNGGNSSSDIPRDDATNQGEGSRNGFSLNDTSIYVNGNNSDDVSTTIYVSSGNNQGWKFISCSHCQELCQQESWLLIGCTLAE